MGEQAEKESTDILLLAGSTDADVSRDVSRDHLATRPRKPNVKMVQCLRETASEETADCCPVSLTYSRRRWVDLVSRVGSTGMPSARSEARPRAARRPLRSRSRTLVPSVSEPTCPSKRACRRRRPRCWRRFRYPAGGTAGPTAASRPCCRRADRLEGRTYAWETAVREPGWASPECPNYRGLVAMLPLRWRWGSSASGGQDGTLSGVFCAVQTLRYPRVKSIASDARHA